MGADADDRMTKINVRVPEELLEAIEEEWERRGYSSLSEAVRDALRDWVDPSPALSDDILAALAESRTDAAAGETVDGETIRDRLDLDD